MSSEHGRQKSHELIYRLRGLTMAGAVLHIGAHPDDEDVGLMAYMARKFGAPHRLLVSHAGRRRPKPNWPR